MYQPQQLKNCRKLTNVQKTRMMIHHQQCGSLYHYVSDMQKEMNGVDA